MEYLWMAAGALVGWVGIEVIVALIGRSCPVTFDLAMAFVGGLVGYTIYF